MFLSEMQPTPRNGELKASKEDYQHGVLCLDLFHEKLPPKRASTRRHKAFAPLRLRFCLDKSSGGRFFVEP